ERQERLYDSLDDLVARLCNPAISWPALYVRFELDLLTELGFGLDLSRCAATGGSDDLAYVSPKTGRAISVAVGEPYRDRLLSLPPFLARRARANGVPPSDILNGLRLTGYFLERHVFAYQQPGAPTGRSTLPAARERLVAILKRRTA